MRIARVMYGALVDIFETIKYWVQEGLFWILLAIVSGASTYLIVDAIITESRNSC